METKTETKKYKLTFHKSEARGDCEYRTYKRYVTSDILVPVFNTSGQLRLAFGHFSIVKSKHDWRVETFEYTEIASRGSYNQTMRDVTDIATHSITEDGWVEEEDFTDCIAILDNGFSGDYSGRSFDTLTHLKQILSWQVDDQGRWIGNAFIQQNETPCLVPEIDDETWEDVSALTEYINLEGISADIVADHSVRSTNNTKFKLGYGYELEKGNTLEDVRDVFFSMKFEAERSFRSPFNSTWETPRRVTAFAKSENRELRETLGTINVVVDWDETRASGTQILDLGPNYIGGVGFINNQGI
jgi:hypothetical protein